MNLASAYHDGSCIYGSDQQKLNQLRAPGGMMRLDAAHGGALPPSMPSFDPTRCRSSSMCLALILVSYT